MITAYRIAIKVSSTKQLIFILLASPYMIRQWNMSDNLLCVLLCLLQ